MKRSLEHYERIAVVGIGITGVSVARFLLLQGITPIVFDTRESPPVIERAPEILAQCEYYFGELQVENLLFADLIVISPGLDNRLDAIQMAQDAGIPIISDIELFAWYAKKPVIGVTGSNGKSTVTELVAHILQGAGYRVGVGGNIGIPALDLISDAYVYDYYVLELSSFQLENISHLHLVGASILNISSDHMDRYNQEQDYIQAKHHIYAHADHVVWNLEDALTRPEEHYASERIVSFTNKAHNSDLSIIPYGDSHWLAWQGAKLIDVQDLPLVGQHNWLNALAAIGLCFFVGVKPIDAVSYLYDFRSLPHRCEWVGTYDEVRWVDDSKATNPGSTLAAITGIRPSVKGKIILIAGGDAKGASFKDLRQALESVDELITLGIDGPRIAHLKKTAHEVNTMEEAVYKAKELAEPGSLVLLSPACSSLDMFKSYQERGHAFRRAMRGAYGE